MVLGQDYRQIGAQVVRKFLKDYGMERSLLIFEQEWNENTEESPPSEEMQQNNRALEMVRTMNIPDISLLSLLDSHLSKPIPSIEGLRSSGIKLTKSYEFDTMENLICIDLTEDSVLVGHASKALDCYDLEGNYSKSVTNHKSPILSVLMHQNLVLSTAMDGSCSIFDCTKNKVKLLRDHVKYCTKALIICDMLVTISHDKTIRIYEQNDDRYQLSKKIIENGIIECMDASASKMVYSVRGDHRAHFIQFPSLDETTFNLNINGDSWVSFNVLDIALNEDYLAIYTDSKAGRIIIYKNGDFLSNLWGPNVDEFSRPKLKWFNDAIICTSENELLVFGLNGEITQKLKFETTVKGLAISGNRLASATGSGKISLWNISDA